MGYIKTSTENPLGFKPWNFGTSNNGLSAYVPHPRAFLPLSEYVRHCGPFLPLSDYTSNPATLPAAPAGFQYAAPAAGAFPEEQLQAIPQGPNWPLIGGVLLGGAALWWFLSQQKKKSVSLPAMVNPYEGFQKLKRELSARGARDAGGLAAWIGRRKYGASEFQRMAAAGRR